MSRLLVIGTGPLLDEGVTFFSGQCLRTWHLVKPLLDAGHVIRLVTLPIDDRATRGLTPAFPERTHGGFRYLQSQTNDLDALLPALHRLCREGSAEAIVGINPFPAAVACRLASDLPLWADMNGYAPCEGQTRGRVHGDDVALEHFWEMEWDVVRRADKISCVTRRQMDATLGELAMAGRLNRHTFDWPFVHFTPNAVADHFMDFRPPAPRLRGSQIGETDFLVLWSGGFNTWTDVDLLHEALERAMAQCPDMHFVATGGAIAGHDERTFERFQTLSRQSISAERRHILGWVPGEVVDALFGEADLGINIDSRNWETHFGARNRVVSMMAAGLPVLTTLGTEISQDLAAAGAVRTCPMGDAATLTDQLLRAHEDGPALRELARRGQAFVREAYSYEATTRDLVAWAANPRRAPDAAGRDSSLEARVSSLDRAALEALRRDQRDLAAIRAKGLWRAAKRVKGLLGRPPRA